MEQVLPSEPTHQYLHGNLIQVFNSGVLILGKPGMGKSRLSWQLMKRGHTHIADDLILLSKQPDNRLVGCALQNANRRIALRNAGILPIDAFFSQHPTILQSTITIGVELIEMVPQNVTKCLLGGWNLTYKQFFGISIKIYQVPVMYHMRIPALLETLVEKEQVQCIY